MRHPIVRLFFFNDTATTEIYTLSLHDALPICPCIAQWSGQSSKRHHNKLDPRSVRRSEEHTSELQSQSNLVCRLLLEKKKQQVKNIISIIATRSTNSRMVTLPAGVNCPARLQL